MLYLHVSRRGAPSFLPSYLMSNVLSSTGTVKGRHPSLITKQSLNLESRVTLNTLIFPNGVFPYYYNFADQPGLQSISPRLSSSNLPVTAIKIIWYPMNHAVVGALLQSLTKTFMGIFKRIKRTIATWLLETDSKSEDTDHEENPSAASSTREIPLIAGPNVDRIVPIYSRETGAIIGYVSHDNG
ncbi:hypothetical protein ARMGADRAFT_1035938 [Armillaria gallica]|uniref:Uncharacterized protein n=1 Tax=Armillaria gallica TaxID=47427 RepID=A0A2H3DEP8_ARMGA|nr:hypothetical protein ARMGADRAFT_1035938 [Armillaria gallica]